MSQSGNGPDGEQSFEALIARRTNPSLSELNTTTNSTNNNGNNNNSNNYNNSNNNYGFRAVPEQLPLHPMSPAYDRLGAMSQDYSRYDRRMSTGSAYSTRASQHDGALLGPRRPRPHKIWKKKYIKLLVVGDSGLGKTTLIKSLMSTPGDRLQQTHDGSFTSSDKFYKDPEALVSTISWRDEEDRVVWVYKIQDTPGYGDEMDTPAAIVRMCKFIEQQNEKWLKMEQSKQRKEDMNEVDDPRIDLCIFCIPPHRLRTIDVKYMYELGKKVPVLPVVTKADSMTIREAGTYRTEVANKLGNPMMPGIREKINIFHFERDTLERAGVVDHGLAIPPFLVVASNDVNEDLNASDPPVYWPERRYPWGTAEAFSREHSDLLSLRALLLKEALEEISKTKRQRYEAWRRKTLGGFKLGNKVLRMLMWTVVPAAVCLQMGRSNMSVQDMREHLRSAVRTAKDKVLRRKQEIASSGSTQPAAAAPKSSRTGAGAAAPVAAPASGFPRQQGQKYF